MNQQEIQIVLGLIQHAYSSNYIQAKQDSLNLLAIEQAMGRQLEELRKKAEAENAPTPPAPPPKDPNGEKKPEGATQTS